MPMAYGIIFVEEGRKDEKRVIYFYQRIIH